jgi:hypothetical protein
MLYACCSKKQVTEELHRKQTVLGSKHVDVNELKSLLCGKPFDMTTEDAEKVAQNLTSCRRKRRKLAKLLFELTNKSELN